MPLSSCPPQMREGSDTFLVHAYLPVEASFGLADEMRRRSSGAASASLLLSHWERLQVRALPPYRRRFAACLLLRFKCSLWEQGPGQQACATHVIPLMTKCTTRIQISSCLYANGDEGPGEAC